MAKKEQGLAQAIADLVTTEQGAKEVVKAKEEEVKVVMTLALTS